MIQAPGPQAPGPAPQGALEISRELSTDLEKPRP